MRGLTCIFLGSWLATNAASGFSLLGPFEPWMDRTNALRLEGDIGGSLGLDQEYRWNIPVVTYGFDPSFVDYFGSNGVAAIEQAIQILNALPPASSLDLSNHPLRPSGINPSAEANGLCDLKSAALSLLLEQMGLAEPVRHIYDLRTLESHRFRG